MNFIFAIYSCKKNISKSEFLFHLIYNKLPNCKCYIIYGDNTLSTDYEIKNDKYLILNCGDYYEDLSLKTIAFFNAIEKIHPTIKGVFKCDDDIIPNIIKINELFTYILNNNDDISYLGNISKKEHISYEGYHIHKVNNKSKYDKKLIMYNCHYVTGPLYYLNMRAIRTFNTHVLEFIKDKDITEYLYEDNLVGYILNSQDIYPHHYTTYYDDISLIKQGSIQNINNQIRKLYIHMHGGLGNQLFQVAATYELAKKHNMHLVLVYKDNFRRHMAHNTNKDEFFFTIFKEFNTIFYNDIDFSNVITYYEPKCFDYNDSIIQENSDYYMEGYFQNQKFLNTYKSEVLQLFQNPSICKELTTKYLLLDESYFIHVRRGDYMNNPTYHFDRDSYFIHAINYIMNKEGLLYTHFFIVSDDIEFCKQNYIFHNIPRKTFIDERITTLQTLYFMSLCKKGGICSNSTFSGWATNLNTNPEKTIVVPKQWINIDYPYEIPFEYSVAI